MPILRMAAGGRRPLRHDPSPGRRRRSEGTVCKMCCFCESKVKYLRADTHFDNHTMQHLLEKNGFERRGIIYLKTEIHASPIRNNAQYLTDFL